MHIQINVDKFHSDDEIDHFNLQEAIISDRISVRDRKKKKTGRFDIDEDLDLDLIQLD